jgi:hypothetical protein
MRLASKPRMIALQLSRDDALFLSEQLRRHLQTVDNELVHTDSHRMQHELAADLERLRAIEDRLREALSEEGERSASAFVAP